MWKSSSVPITQKDLLSSRSGGSSNERSHGSGGADVSPKIGRISIARRSHFCASLKKTDITQDNEVGPTCTIRYYFASKPVKSSFEQRSSSICRDSSSAFAFNASIFKLSGCSFSSSMIRLL